MAKDCAMCGSTFTLSAEENVLREKIGSMLAVGPIPEPTFCIACRTMQKMTWRNERMLYRRTCSKTNKEIISAYPANAPFPVYERSEWFKDDWDATDYGQEFDFTRTFADQFKELQTKVPRPALSGKNTENCDYCNFGFDCRNSYLTFCLYYSESLFYCYWMLECKDCYDCSYCFKCERCLFCTDCNESYNCTHCTLCTNCSDSSYLYDCRGCRNCFGCVGLRKKSFCMFNEQLSEDEYKQRLKEFDLQDPDHVEAVENRLKELKLKHPHHHSIQEKCEDCTGDFLFENKHCTNCYQMFRSRDCINCADADGNTDLLDTYHPGWSELLYGGYSSVRLKTSAWFAQCWDGNNIFYSDNCQNCSDCFGCIGLRYKKFCILNKQYSREDYEKLLPKVVQHMKDNHEYGEFFAPDLCPFAYNESVAPDYYALSKEEAVKRGWKWKDDLPFTTGKETVAWKDIPKNINDIENTILKEVLCCTSCSRNYRIIEQELAFYKEKQLPLPRHCPECRHGERIGLRNARKLWNRACDACGKDIETTYAPDRPEKVYCEECYLKAVY